MRNLVCVIFLLLGSAFYANAQKAFPYECGGVAESLNAYWYVVPIDSVAWQKNSSTSYFYSVAHVYGKVPEGDFSVSVKAFDSNNIFFTREIQVSEDKASNADAVYLAANGNFRIEFPVNTGLKRPDKIEIELKSKEGNYKKTVSCVYHTISGRITDFDGNPFKGFFRAAPDDFPNSISVWADNEGYYNITLPERSYNTYYSDDHTYGMSSLEYWGWRMIVDRDETIDIAIGNGEVYNLHAWSSNGGYSTFFLYFRPMVLPKALLPEEKYTSAINIGANSYNNINIAPELSEKDITVKVNGEKLDIISLQPVYETGRGSDGNFSMNAYLVQVERPKSSWGRKLTFTLSYDTYITVNGEKVRVNSMGNCQLYTNITGLSEY
ncbi:MAG: hypothetical protein LBL90_09980 [Prevotellaceae bacterium]|jgi:hypothetical protein|nr:hypothetical protein [Prevotellaceae bacterium]